MAAVSEDGGQIWKPAEEVSVAEAVETVDEGGLYVVNDEGERKATGAYYTPDYVVTYIIEETIDPLIEEIDADLREQGFERSDREYFAQFWQRVQELKILDPAMGSGHFLTKATGYLTEQVMEVVREQEIQSYDEQYIRREISKECIYGVDLNGMAVELAKLSMWLETLATDQPLAFLDHHLKEGNSLVGSDVAEVLSEDNGEDNDGQLTLTQAFAHVRQDTLEHVMDLMQDLLAYDNETLDDVKSMEELYEEIRGDSLYTRLFELANVHTAEQFGLDVPDDAYEEMASAIEDDDDWEEISERDWFASSQAMAEEEDFFHWELEYPEVFFNENGEIQRPLGFDAVVGNPPYVSSRNESFYDRGRRYFDQQFEMADYQVDLYYLFSNLASELTKEAYHWSFIIPDSWLGDVTGEAIRQWVVDQNAVKAVTLPKESIFSAGVDCLILLSKRGKRGDCATEVRTINKQLVTYERTISLPTDGSVFVVAKGADILEKVEDPSIQLNTIAKTGRGIGPYHHSKHDEETIENREYHANTQVDEAYRPELGGKNVQRYNINWPGDRWISYGEWLAEPRESDLFEDERIFCRKILSSRLCVTYTDEDWLVDQQVYVATNFEPPFTALYVAGILASSLMGYFVRTKYHEDTELFPHLRVTQFRELPIRRLSTDTGSKSESVSAPTNVDQFLNNDLSIQDVVKDVRVSDMSSRLHISELVRTIQSLNKTRGRLNLNLLDYLVGYEQQSITESGLHQPLSDRESILHKTKEELGNLRVGYASVDRETPNTVLIEATARYKPDDEDAHETDQWGYTETDYLPAFRITDLTETEANLIEHFVPVAVNEADGFANFRETATKTNSLIDRLKAIELPDVDDIADELDNYLRTKEHAEELDEKIEKTDQLIDEIVYELYGLTDEEIEIVEEAVGE